MTQKISGITSELFVGYVDSEDASEEELEKMNDRELTKLGVLRLEVSPGNFTDEELARFEALEEEGYSPSYIFNAGLEAIDRSHAHDVRMIFSIGLAELEKRTH